MGLILKKYIWVLSLFCTLLISYMLAKIATLFIEGTFFPNAIVTAAPSKEIETSQVGQKTQEIDLDVILNRNFFDANESVLTTEDVPSTEENTDETKDSEKVKTGKAVPTSLDIKLQSTISVGNGENKFSSCVVSSKREMNTYTIKDKDPFGADTKIVRILPKRVEFLNQGQLEYVELEDFAKAVDLNKKPETPTSTIAKRITKPDDEGTSDTVKLEGNVFKIPRSEIDKALSDIKKLYQDVRAVPYYREGRPMGFRFLSVKRGSLFQQLGLRRGDIVKSVNGQVLDIQTGMQTFNLLKTETEFKLEIERRGEEKVFNYEII